MLIGLSPCPRHSSGNVGDQLATESTKKIIRDIHGAVEFDVYFKREDFTSRLDYINSADAIILFGFEILREKTRPENYRIAEHLDDVNPPLIPDGSSYCFYPGDHVGLSHQRLGPTTKSFLDRTVPNCPKGKIPVRDGWVRYVLQQNGYKTVLTGDPGWYDLDMLGKEFHRPKRIDQLVFTTPHRSMYIGQAKRLLRQLSKEFDGADRILSLQSAPSDNDRKLFDVAQQHGWTIHFASHETSNLELYRESDLHVGYRLHGHIAHLRWRRPSLILAEDSRAQGLTETFSAGGIPAFDPREASGFSGLARRFPDTTLGRLTQVMVNKSGYSDVFPVSDLLKATPNPTAVQDTLDYINDQMENDWTDYIQIREMMDDTYRSGMRPYLKNVLENVV